MEEKRGKASEIVGELGKIAISEEVITKIAELAA